MSPPGEAPVHLTREYRHFLDGFQRLLNKGPLAGTENSARLPGRHTVTYPFRNGSPWLPSQN